MFRKERQAVVNATETAKKGINTTLVVSAVACLIAVLALVIALVK